MEPEEKDALLLKELGLSSTDSARVEQKITNLNMRQLDRLKVMLGRIDEKGGLFTQSILLGIKNNDLKSFTDAVLILAQRQMKKHN